MTIIYKPRGMQDVYRVYVIVTVPYHACLFVELDSSMQETTISKTHHIDLTTIMYFVILTRLMDIWTSRDAFMENLS